jgi:hypothetical protein
MADGKEDNMVTPKNIGAFVVYCLPCIVALGIILYYYHERTCDVGKQLTTIAESFQDYVITQSVLDSLKAKQVPEDVLDRLEGMKDRGFGRVFRKMLKDSLANTADSNYADLIEPYARNRVKANDSGPPPKDAGELAQLNHFFRKQKGLAQLDSTINKIDSRIDDIWSRNSAIIALMVFLPYLLLGSRLAFAEKVGLDPNQRMAAAKRHWAMKFVVACVMALGWLYVVNPSGRATTTIQEYLNAVDIFKGETLPIFIAAKDISHTAAGFLGWYLYLLLHFFRKLYHNDVVSARVYRFLFGKFLFTYGIALTFSAVLGDESKMALFLIGFFPLSAVSILKEYGMKATKGVEGKSPLSGLPGTSLWHITRLEEEGVDSISTLATFDLDKVEVLPRIMRPLVRYWMDVAQLHTILGEDRYGNVKVVCQTASEFVRRANEPDFQASLKANGVENPQEIYNLLLQAFPRLKAAQEKALSPKSKQ